MKIKINRAKAIYVLYMVFVLNVTYSIFYSPSARILQVPLAALGIVYMFTSNGFGRLKRITVNEFNAFCTPMIIITAISVFTSIAVYHTSNPSDWKQSIVRCFYYVIPFLAAYYSVRKFGDDTPRLLLISGFISYATVFVRYIYYGGIGILFHFFNNKANGISLEVHNFTYCMGLFFLYYLLSDKYDKNFKVKVCLILMIGIFFGDKRALYLGLAVTLLIYFLFHKFQEKRLTLLKVIFVIYIAAAFLYLWLIKSGIFEAILYRYNINDMSRLTFWNYFSGVYEISPFYWGRGIAYTDNIMGATETMREMHVTAATNIHNDILRAYIGWGFLPTLYYFVNFFLFRVRRFVKDNNEENGWRYFAIASLYLFINFFDNMLSAENFNLCFFVIYLLLMKKQTKEMAKEKSR